MTDLKLVFKIRFKVTLVIKSIGQMIIIIMLIKSKGEQNKMMNVVK